MSGSKSAGGSLVRGFMENISREMLENIEYRKILNDYVKNKSGIYALYKGDNLKYVGLAANLPGRLATHLKDRHADSWDRFSVYITHNDEHMRELESLILRITQPKGNKVRGRLKGAENLKKMVKSDLTVWSKRQHQNLLPTGRNGTKADRKADVAKKPSRQAQLAGYFSRASQIRLDYKGTVYKAVIQKDGSIKYGDTIYTSPSIAGARIIGRRSLNGWKAWKFKNANGEWVVLDELRKRQKSVGQKQGASKKPDGKFAGADTIVCPAKEDGFQKTFLGENCWYAIRLRKSRIQYIKYLAIYRVRPISAITHYAKVERIEPYKNTGKYVVIFKGSPKKVGPISSAGRHGPQGPVFSSFSKLSTAKTLNDL